MCRTHPENCAFAETGRAQAPLLPPAHLPNRGSTQECCAAPPRLLETELPKCSHPLWKCYESGQYFYL